LIHIIATSANVEKDYDVRKDQYLAGLEAIMDHYKIEPHIIEVSKQVDYLPPQYVDSEVYSPNKGNNEFINIDNFMNKHSEMFHDNDDVIKITLRYQVISSYFVDFIKENNQYDAYFKHSSDIYGANDTGVHTFLFCMKYKYWQDFLKNHFDRNTHKDYPIEAQIAKYLKTLNVKYLDKLDILASPSNHRKTYKV